MFLFFEVLMGKEGFLKKNKHGVSKSSLLNSWPIGASICQPSLAHFKSFPLFDLRDYVKQS